MSEAKSAMNREDTAAPGQPLRRAFLRAGLQLGIAASLPGCSSVRTQAMAPPAQGLSCKSIEIEPPREFDYIVVGSGAGGGPLCANLARAGYSVLLLEAGGDPLKDSNGDENFHYSVPAFHPQASEDPRLAWNYYVRHYADRQRRARDSKYLKDRDGVLYPRAGVLGGCTAHNAMLTMCPHNSDWDSIARLTGDDSWASSNMRQYFERMERCRYANWFLDPNNAARHGFAGWLTTERPDFELLLQDPRLLKTTQRAVEQALVEQQAALGKTLRLQFDPNDWRAVQAADEGLFMPPLSTLHGRRRGTRDYVREVEAACAGRLTVRTEALTTRILFDANNRATGVEYLQGASLYRADARSAAAGPGLPRAAFAGREVILCAGAFNSPQLLMLSGIGPRAELEHLGIPVRVDLPGVGRNLQDRYEVGVVSRMNTPFAMLAGCTFDSPPPGGAEDDCFKQWRGGKGVYTTNGGVLGIIMRSTPDVPVPDLFILGLPRSFRGYYPGYSREILQYRDRLSWVVLKAHTRNRAGQVTLKSDDPRDVPDIDFNYFADGDQADLQAVVDGVEFARRLNQRAQREIGNELIPGPGVHGREQVAQFVQDEAWGHHASCSNRMGPQGDPLAVVDSRFRVFGVSNLRVVDASVFPTIPGFFIVAPIYMISEKASDVIIADAKRHDA